MRNVRFLEKVADELLTKDRDLLLETVVVFPNRRPKIFLSKYLQKKASGPLWAPDMLSVDEMMETLSQYQVQDPILTWFELYDIHRTLEKDESRDAADFLNWAPVMLNDFNEADQALVDIERLFNYLSEIKSLELWQLDGRELTDFEKRYLQFYKQLGDYHAHLKKRLHDKGLATKGLLYRDVAEHIEKKDVLPWKHFVFVGFNAMTKAEQKVVSVLLKRKVAEVFWDLDKYYYSTQKDVDAKDNMAGRFVSENIRRLGIDHPKWVEDLLLTDSKTVEIIAVPKKMAQVQLAAEKVEQWLDEGTPIEETAIVLADESLLIPLLTALPVEGNYNVTMGYPLKSSPFFKLFDIWLDLLLVMQQKNGRVSVVWLLSLLRNPNVRWLVRGVEKVIERIQQERQLFVSLDDLARLFGPENRVFLQVLFSDGVNTVDKVLERFLSFVSWFKKILLEKEAELGKERFEKRYPMLKQQVAEVLKVLKKLVFIQEKRLLGTDLLVLKKLFLRIVSKAEVSLRGEPLKGIQIMGMLETRLLDFDRIMVLSANEGSLPKTGFSDSFIPFDVKNNFEIPLPTEKTSVFAYHFFRLLQRAKQASYLYDSEPGSLGGGEKSRFLYQLELDLASLNKQMQIRNMYLKYDSLPKVEPCELSIEKSEDVMEQLTAVSKKGFSASSLNRYIECPLKFYLSDVAKINLPDELKPTIEADVLGSLVHRILEKIYQPLVGKEITVDYLKAEKEKIEDYFSDALNDLFAESGSKIDIHSGKNILLVAVIKKMVKNFLEEEISNLAKERRVLLGVEKRVETKLKMNGIEVKVKGVIDRIDKHWSSGEIRIVDYKTGAVENMKLKAWHDLLLGRDFAKAFQALLYGWLYEKTEKPAGALTMGMFSLRALSKGFKKVVTPEGEDFFEPFEKQLTTLLEMVLDPDRPFLQTDDLNACKYCDYKAICNR